MAIEAGTTPIVFFHAPECALAQLREEDGGNNQERGEGNGARKAGPVER